MTLLSPTVLFALAALAVPILVHLVRREDRDGTAYPSLMFLKAVPVQVRQKRKLRNPLLLLLRCLALVALILAFATPLVKTTLSGLTPSTIDHSVVIALDRSYSMSPDARWETAKTAAIDALNDIDGNTQFALIVFDTSAVVANEFTQDKAQLVRALEVLEPGSHGTIYTDVFNLAGRLFEELDTPKHLLDQNHKQSLILVSDLQASAFHPQSRLRLAKNVDLKIVPVTEAVTDNLAVMDVRLVTDTNEPQGNTSRLEVTLRNTGEAATVDRAWQLVVDDEVRAQPPVSLGSGETELFNVPIVLASDRAINATIALDEDEIPVDNTWHSVVSQGRKVRVALINDDQATKDTSVFIRQAVELASNQYIDLDQYRVSDWESIDNDPYDVVIVNDIATMSSELERTLLERIDGGQGAIVVAANHPPFSHLTQRDRAASPMQSGDLPWRIGVVDRAHPLANVLDRQRSLSLSGTGVFTYRPVTVTPQDHVIAKLDNGAPLIIEREVGRGRLLVFTTTLDPRWNSLVLEPGFVTLMATAIDRVAQRSWAPTAYKTGDSLDVVQYAGALPGGDQWRYQLSNSQTVMMETPSGTRRTLTIDRDKQTDQPIEALLTVLDAPGTYEIHGRNNRTLSVAVNTSRNESMLTTLSPADFRQRVSPSPRQQSQSATATDNPVQESQTNWNFAFALLILAFVLFITESLLSNRITQRKDEAPAT